MLKPTDKKHYGPVQEIAQRLYYAITPQMKVLDIGPGTRPFMRADVFVDISDKFPSVPKEKLVIANAAKGGLPFADKSFDFITCRHVLEDLYDPFSLCKEMSRVGKAGYIETPSPIAELCMGIDGDTADYRGYHHHRFMVWVCEQDRELRFVTKYPIVEHLDIKEDAIGGLLKPSAKYWNTYYPWHGNIRARHIENGIDYDFWSEYHKVVGAAVLHSQEATDAIWKKLAPKKDQHVE